MGKLVYENITKDKSKTALILCVFVRLENFKISAECLEYQTNKDFDLYICDNSNRKEKVIGLTKKFIEPLNINTSIVDYKNKYKPFCRFILAKKLAEQGYDKIIFIDDDEIFSQLFIQDCYDQYEENTVKSFWSHRIEAIYRKKVKLEKDEIGNYIGPGGLVCSSKVFLDEDLFMCPEEFWIVDDLWLSYYLLKYTNYKIKTLKTNIEFIQDRKATHMTLGKLKQEFADAYILPESKALPPLG
jgi:hypothetical protein